MAATRNWEKVENGEILNKYSDLQDKNVREVYFTAMFVYLILNHMLRNCYNGKFLFFLLFSKIHLYINIK